jgi:hypothetical protein
MSSGATKISNKDLRLNAEKYSQIAHLALAMANTWAVAKKRATGGASTVIAFLLGACTSSFPVVGHLG